MGIDKVKERWRCVKGYPGYWISDHGRVRSPRKTYVVTGSSNAAGSIATRQGRVLKPSSNGKYKTQTLFKWDSSGKRTGHKVLYIHRLVAYNFISDPGVYMEVNHKDGDRLNNHIDNLEWSTRQDNMRHYNDSI